MSQPPVPVSTAPSVSRGMGCFQAQPMNALPRSSGEWLMDKTAPCRA
jgi:hypothetical protein